MTAGVVKDAFDMSVGAAFHMPTQRGSMAGRHHLHGLSDVLLKGLGLFEGRIGGGQQVNESIRGWGHHLDRGRRHAMQPVGDARLHMKPLRKLHMRRR